jgi:hypothetical protein
VKNENVKSNAKTLSGRCGSRREKAATKKV